jgi:hypothetical protein
VSVRVKISEGHSPQTHDVVGGPADKEYNEDDDRHFQGLAPGPVQEHQARTSEAVCNISSTTIYQLLSNERTWLAFSIC